MKISGSNCARYCCEIFVCYHTCTDGYNKTAPQGQQQHSTTYNSTQSLYIQY